MARGGNLRISNTLLSQMANPSFGNAVGVGIGQAMLGPQLRKEKKETEDFYQQLMKAGETGDSAQMGSLLAARGADQNSPQMVIQGMGMMADARKQQGLMEIDGFMNIYADPTQSLENRNAALAKAETLAA